jgi:hypothetical protein
MQLGELLVQNIQHSVLYEERSFQFSYTNSVTCTVYCLLLLKSPTMPQLSQFLTIPFIISYLPHLSRNN